MLTKSALAYLAVVGAVVGIWALGFPTDFYNAFPGCGRTWVSVDGPYNEHLVRDVGAFYIGSGILAACGLFWSGSVHPRVVGLASIAFNLPHLIYHFSKLNVFTSPIDQIGNVVALGLALLASIYLIFAARLKGANWKTELARHRPVQTIIYLWTAPNAFNASSASCTRSASSRVRKFRTN